MLITNIALFGGANVNFNGIVGNVIVILNKYNLFYEKKYGSDKMSWMYTRKCIWYSWILPCGFISLYETYKSSLNDKYGNVLISFKECTIEELFNNDENEDFAIFHKEDRIRAFVITSENVNTIYGIHVGDNISKVEDKFEYEKFYGNTLCEVIFNGDTESNDFDNPQDDWIRISYRINEEKITAIIISDNKFACYLQ